MDEKLLLQWDDFPGHWTQDVLYYAASINVVLMKVPPRYTYVSQPADVAWNQAFKCRLRGRWLAYLRDQIAAHHAHDKERAKLSSKLTEDFESSLEMRYRTWLEYGLVDVKTRQTAPDLKWCLQHALILGAQKAGMSILVRQLSVDLRKQIFGATPVVSSPKLRPQMSMKLRNYWPSR
ncbi:unnamed protein product [Phytophthora fragariaefolia]|uniref:Unnamed protein product n=1 Tax=Phytophthora fragariaefolia TaxID=1490495 RepID=A0A9W7CYB8_9STRA|nr:unnamed protein product [Phytophthora fragariaefolia]